MGPRALEHERSTVATARFTHIVSHGTGASWDFIGFNGDIGHHFIEVVDIGPEIIDDHASPDPIPMLATESGRCCGPSTEPKAGPRPSRRQTDLRLRNEESMTRAAVPIERLVFPIDFECEPNVHHGAGIVAHFDCQ